MHTLSNYFDAILNVSMCLTQTYQSVEEHDVKLKIVAFTMQKSGAAASENGVWYFYMITLKAAFSWVAGVLVQLNAVIVLMTVYIYFFL